MNKTEWYPTTIPPVRPGWYEVLFDGQTSPGLRCFYNGRAWCLDESSCPCLFGNPTFKDFCRGLKEPS